MENTKQKSDNTELGVLWSRVSKNNEKFLSGKLNLKAIGFDKDVEIIVFKNRNKTAEKHPDLRIYQSQPRPAGAKTTAAPKQAAPVPVVAEQDNSIL